MSEPFVGQIALFGFPFAPRGWHVCDGSLVAVSQNQALFALIGTTYGGNGSTTFGLPDLRGRVPVSQGTGPGLSPYNIGQIGGTQTQSLNATNLPPHTHPASLQVTVPGKSSTETPANAASGSLVAGNVANFLAPVSPADPTVTLAASTVTVQPNAGSSAPFSILEPYLAVNFCIALQGIFPSRN